MRGKENLVRCAARHPLVESLCVLFLFVAVSTTTAQTPVSESSEQLKIIYVDARANGLDIGTSWANAITSLQDALLLAYFYEKPVEIRVAQGVYTPDRGIGIMPGDSTASFQLINGVTIKGGYTTNLGRRGTDIRDIHLYESILSGDLNADDVPDIISMRENSFHVVSANGVNTTAVLDGLTITGGGGNDEDILSYGGGGMCNDRSSPMLINCTFRGNATGKSGGGMYNNSSNPVLLNCTFSGNVAPRSGGMYNDNSSPTLTNCSFIENSGGIGGGGGMYNANSSPMLSDCVFRGNSTTGSGGGMYNENSNPTLLGCTFRINSAQRSGGGMCNFNNSRPSITNCIFNGNSSGGSGGGIENISESCPTLINCTFSANSASAAGDGGGGGGGISGVRNSQMILVNCILWADTPNEIQAMRESVIITYSDVQNGWPGEGNLDIYPLFTDPENGDFHLKSQAGRWDPVSQSWVIDQISSSCIDAGDPGIPVGLERFPNGGRINMGAYGGTAEASLSPQQQSNFFSKATDPDPANEAENVPRDVTLRWTAGINAVWHNVYFGPDINDMELVSIRQTTTEFELENLDYETTYYWRIDEVNRDGTTTGEIWTFTTACPPRR